MPYNKRSHFLWLTKITKNRQSQQLFVIRNEKTTPIVNSHRVVNPIDKKRLRLANVKNTHSAKKKRKNEKGNMTKAKLVNSRGIGKQKEKKKEKKHP